MEDARTMCLRLLLSPVVFQAYMRLTWRMAVSTFLIGDGRLNYAPEYVWESYYSARLFPGFFTTLDAQHVANPAFNHDRGPALGLEHSAAFGAQQRDLRRCAAHDSAARHNSTTFISIVVLLGSETSCCNHRSTGAYRPVRLYALNAWLRPHSSTLQSS